MDLVSRNVTVHSLLFKADCKQSFKFHQCFWVYLALILILAAQIKLKIHPDGF